MCKPSEIRVGWSKGFIISTNGHTVERVEERVYAAAILGMLGAATDVAAQALDAAYYAYNEYGYDVWVVITLGQLATIHTTPA